MIPTQPSMVLPLTSSEAEKMTLSCLFSQETGLVIMKVKLNFAERIEGKFEQIFIFLTIVLLQNFIFFGR